MISLMLTNLLLGLCLALFLRLFTYRRQGARFRRGISIVATLVMGCSGAVVLYILQGKLIVPPHAWPLIGLLAVFTVAVMRSEGNLSSVLRNPTGWDGTERRQ